MGFDISVDRTAAETILAMPDQERPTGVFALNDLVAIGLLQGLMRRNVTVPEEISIVGYDDFEFAKAAAVPLSSVAQPRADLGRRAAILLLEEIDAQENGDLHRHARERFTPTLKMRSSSLDGIRTPCDGATSVGRKQASAS